MAVLTLQLTYGAFNSELTISLLSILAVFTEPFMTSVVTTGGIITMPKEARDL